MIVRFNSTYAEKSKIVTPDEYQVLKPMNELRKWQEFEAAD